MKIVFASASVSRNYGGIFEVERRLAQSLYSTGNAIVEVIGLEDEHSHEDAKAWLPIQTHAFPIKGVKSFGYAPGYLEFLNQSDADIGHLHSLWMYPSVATRLWSKKNNKPYVTTINGMLDPWAIQHSKWKKLIASALYEKAALKQTSCIQANTFIEYQSIRRFGLKNPVCLISNGVDLEERAVVTSESPWKGIMEEGKKVLLLLGRVHPKKGHLHLLEAWAMAKQSGSDFHDDWHLVIVGCQEGGSYENILQQVADRLHIKKSVTFLGPHFGKAMQVCYQHANAFILPSFSEGVPMAVLSAWANSLPCLITPQCNLPEGFDSEAAIRIDPNATSTAEGLRTLFAMTKEELIVMGNKGRHLVEEKFSWPRVANQMLEVYNWVLGGGSPPNCVMMQ